MSATILVLGLGNDLVGDDALGPMAVRRLAQTLPHPAIRYESTAEAGLRLLDHITGFRYLLVIDVLQDSHRPAGTLLEYSLEDLPASATAMSLHAMGLAEVLATGKALGLAMPREGRVLAVVARDLQTLGAPLSPEVAQTLPRLLHRAREVLETWLKNASF